MEVGHQGVHRRAERADGAPVLRVSLDAAPVISAVEQVPGYGEAADARLAAPGVVPATIELTRLECWVKPWREGDADCRTSSRALPGASGGVMIRCPWPPERSKTRCGREVLTTGRVDRALAGGYAAPTGHSD